jgi:ADP-ribose pyrophosphatase YjhB (NUDIX family)
MNMSCLNCNNFGHCYSKCSEPLTSYGIICFNIKDKIYSDINNLLYNQYVDIYDYNYNHINNIYNIKDYNNNIKFLMIRRKHSLTYIEFIRGRYNLNNKNDIHKLFSLMSQTEVNLIKNNTFNYLWENLWMSTAFIKPYIKEYIISKNKFSILKYNNFYDLLNSDITVFTEPEWCFPKGRRNLNENNLDCAIREFKEETNIDNINLITKIKYIQEQYKGTNNINYKNIYYFSYSNNTINPCILEDSFEVSDIKWLSISECLEKIRLYDKTKLQMIKSIYFFIVNHIINNCNSLYI